MFFKINELRGSSERTIKRDIKQSGFERKTVWFAFLASAGIVIIHLAAILIRTVLPGISDPVRPVTIGTVCAAAVAAWYTAGILPARLDGTARRHPGRAALVAAISLLMVFQTARMAANRVNPGNTMVIMTANPLVTRHECGTAYFHAVELNNRGVENIYLAEHYPALNRDAEPHSKIEGLEVGDAYQYPPQFLLLPKLMLTFTNDYPTIRYLWFALQFLGVGTVVLLLARWVGGTTGDWMALLAPWIIVAPAALYTYQYTQFHFAAIALAVAGMLAFEQKRNALGGALLAFAVIGKIFPAFLVILLLAERRWKALAWTLGFGLAYTAAALMVLGLAPFNAFLGYQLPRMQSFAAFSFLETWPEVRFELIAANLSPYGQVIRLGEMGLPGMTAALASACNTLFALLLVAATWLAARRVASRVRRAQLWLAVLGLASMASPAAWGEYTCLPALWLLTILAVGGTVPRIRAIIYGICGVFFYFLLGVIPTRIISAPMVVFSLSSISFVLLVALQGWVLMRRSPIAD